MANVPPPIILIPLTPAMFKFCQQDSPEAHPKVTTKKRRTEKKRRCNLCGRIVRPSNYVRHVRKCSNRRGYFRFRCYFCGKVFSTRSNFHRHISALHSKERPYSCQKCRFRSAYGEAVIKIHERTQHPTGRRLGGGGDIITCYFCGKNSFGNHYQLNDHLKYHHLQEKALKCEKCPKRFSIQNSLKCHGMTCGKPKKKAIRQHVVSKDHNALVECPKCFKLMKPQNIPAHTKTVHEKIRRTRKCPICSTIVNHDIRRHMEHHHPNNGEEYPCDVCGKTFSTKLGLQVHKKIHGARVRMTCPQCGVNVLAWWYNAHVRQVHGPPKFICYFCGTRFKTNSRLCTHLLGHHVKENSFRCEHYPSCSYRTYDRLLLQYHLKTKTHSTPT